MNNLQFRFGSNTPIGEQEKVIIKKLQAKVLEVLSKGGDDAYDEYAKLSFSIPLSELSGDSIHSDNTDEFVTYLFGFEKIIEESDGEGHLCTTTRHLFEAIRITNKRKVLIFVINRAMVESVFLSDK